MAMITTVHTDCQSYERRTCDMWFDHQSQLCWRFHSPCTTLDNYDCFSLVDAASNQQTQHVTYTHMNIHTQMPSWWSYLGNSRSVNCCVNLHLIARTGPGSCKIGPIQFLAGQCKRLIDQALVSFSSVRAYVSSLVF